MRFTHLFLAVLGVVAVITLLALSGCGGGGGSPSASAPGHTHTPPSHYKDFYDIPAVSGDCESNPCLDAIEVGPMDNTPTGQMNDRLYKAGPIVHIYAPFRGGEGTFRRYDPSKSYLVAGLLGREVEATPSDESHGIRTATLSDGNFTAFAQWGEYSVVLGYLDRQDIGAVYYAWEAGPWFTRTDPAGPATWSGPATAQNTRTGAVLDGETSLSLRASGALDVAVNLSDGASHTWDDLQLKEGGFDKWGLTGRFHGPNQEEAAGWFRFEDVTGIFAARKD
ncbi:MAG: hypothetical protein OXC11_00805 [Rhodospirillales bacterium]|nr:hypothetical protein [Rhodospirillales bacterium]